MLDTFADKDRRRLREKEQEAEENRRYLEFIQKKEEQAEQHKAKRAELEAMK